MAGFADPRTLPPAPSRRPLPNGPCNYRDASLGPCGCDQFWDKLSADLHDESTEHRPGSERSTWCVCGHHACFHLKASRAPERRAPSISVPLPSPHVLCEGQCQTLPRVPCDAHAGLRLAVSGGHQSMRLERFNSQSTHSQRHLLHTSRVHEPGRIVQSQDTPSQATTSGLPGIPSVCLLSHEQRPVANKETRHGVSQSHHSVTGLGLSTMRLESMCQVNRQQSPTPTIPDDINIAGTPQTNRNERDPSLIRANTNSPSHAIIEHVLPFNRNIQLDIPGDTIPNTYNPEEYVQSTTEVATPSAGATPDLSAADRAVQEGKNLIDTLARMTSDMQQQAASSPDRPTNATVPTQLLLENSPSVPQEQLQNLLQTASPQGLQKLVSYLAPLHNLLNSIPNVANTMRDLGSRLDMLENGSFNYVQPEDLNQTLEMYEGRLIEVEHRVDEHEKMHQALDDHGSISSFSRRHIKDANTSFGSNHSAESTTSSALILAAMDRKDTEMELDHIKQRLDVLEAAAPPTSLAPWEIEVVLLPWGPDLRGIWFSQDDPMHDVDRTTTQSSEEWTQARSSRTSTGTPMLEMRRRDTDSSPYPGAPMLGSNPVLNQHESGWSSQDITNWASGSTDDWLFPKACGSNNLVYKRLQSRGFVRDITLRGASAKDVQETLSNAFSDVFDHLQYDDSDENPMIAAYPGLRASYIPLRKVLRESRLRFLTPAEMSSSAFWTAQFLASGVMMRVSGGKKRLYVTHREAYTQQVDRNEFVVMEQSWPELRQLPRYQPEKNLQTDGNDEDCQPHVPEADAKEACWQFVEAYDAPPASMHSSFGSNQSAQLSMRPAGRQWRRSITPSSILKKQTHPISPLSENHPRLPSSHRNRTVSASAMDTFPLSSAKRRYNGSPIKQSSAPQTVSRTPSLMSRLKRRRVTESTSPRPQEDAREEPRVPIWTATPRRSREPPSPFYSSQPPLPRSYSDIASRPSQRSVAMTGKSTPFAYATPHSGPFVGGPGYSAYNNGGDTEPDDDDDAYNDDDGEQSWHGVTDGESVMSSIAGAAISAQEGASFSGDDSGFGSDNENDSDVQSEEDAEDHAQRQQDDGDEDEDDVFDSLLSIIED